MRFKLETRIGSGRKRSSPWGVKEFIILMMLEFGFVMIGIKYAVQRAYEAWFGNTLYSGTLTGLTIAVVLMTGLYVTALRPLRLSWKEVGLKRFPSKDWPRILGWTLLLIVLSVLTAMLTSYLGVGTDNSKTESLREKINFYTVLIGIISAGVVSPVYEEIFYRGFIHRWLASRIGTGLGMLVSSLIFTAAHFPTLNAMPVNFISGVVLAWTYERTGSVIPGMIVHGIFNTIAVLLTVTG